MSTGFNSDYEEIIIRGNLSIEASDCPLEHGDGSVEIAQTLYVDNIKEYTHAPQTQGICIGDVQINFDAMYIPFTAPSIGFTSGSLVSRGGITINNTANCTNASNGGALTVFGGTSISKDLCMGGLIDVGGNLIQNLQLVPTLDHHATSKWYVDDVSGRAYGNYTTGQIIIAETVGTAIRGFDSFTFSNGNLSLTGNLIVNDVDITPKSGEEYTTATLLNNQSTFVNVDSILFDESVVKAVVMIIVVTINTTTGSIDQMFETKGLNLEPGWCINNTSIGEISGIKFKILGGQLMYTSTNIANWTSATLRCKVTSILI